MPSSPASPIHAYLADLHARHARNASGALADYIPELAHADPDWFGICIATHDGIVYEVGDTRQPFTIQSVSKPFTYGLALARSRRGGRARQDRRGAVGRRLQRDQPAAPNRCSDEPADQCRRNRRVRAGAGDGGEAASRASWTRSRATRAGRWTSTSGSTRSESAHRPPQSRDRLDAAQLRHPGRRADADARDLLPPVRDPCHLPRPGDHGRDARQRRRQSRHRRARARPALRGQRAVGDGDLRHVRLLRRVALPDRTCRPRAASAAASSPCSRAARHRRVLAAPRRARQQRARHRRLPRARGRPRPAHLRRVPPAGAGDASHDDAAHRRVVAARGRRRRATICAASATACGSISSRVRWYSRRSSR